MSSPKRASNKCGMPSCKSKPSRGIAAFGIAHCNALRSNFGLDRTLVSRQHWFRNGRGINFCHEFGLATTKSIDKRHHGCGEFSKANPNLLGAILMFLSNKNIFQTAPCLETVPFFSGWCVSNKPSIRGFHHEGEGHKSAGKWPRKTSASEPKMSAHVNFFPKMKHQLCHKPLGRRMQTGRWQGPMRSNRCLAAKCLQLLSLNFEAVSPEIEWNDLFLWTIAEMFEQGGDVLTKVRTNDLRV